MSIALRIATCSKFYGIQSKKILLLASLIQVMICGVIISMESIHWLIILRFLQGISVCFMIVPARAIIADLFTGEAFNQHMNRLALSWAR